MNEMDNGNAKKYIITKPPLDVQENSNGLGDEFFRCMKKYSRKILQIDANTGKKETYEECLQKCVRTAIEMKKRGINREDIICICSSAHLNDIVPLISGLFLGVKVASLDPTLPLGHTKYLLSLIKPNMVFVSLDALKYVEEALEQDGQKGKIIVFGEHERYGTFSEFFEATPEEESFAPVKIDNDRDTAMIFFSSGSVGVPKGVCFNHYATARTGLTFGKYQFQNDDVILTDTSTYWLAFVNLLTVIIFYGHARIVTQKIDPKLIWTHISTCKATFVQLAPTYLLEALKYKPDDFKHEANLRVSLIGVPVAENQMKEAKKLLPEALIFQGYGMTEAANITCFDLSTEEGVKLSKKKIGSCGTPFGGVSYKIVDLETGNILGPGGKGELLIKTNHIMNGYLHGGPHDCFDEVGWFKTGDILYYDQDECFYYVGRCKDTFKYRGWNVPPVPIEEIIKKHPAVFNAVVIGIPHEIDGDHPMGIVTIKEGYEEVAEEEIRKFVDDRVHHHHRKLRGGVKIVREIPLSSTGKPKRSEIRQKAISNLL